MRGWDYNPPVPDHPTISVALETSGRDGVVALGIDGKLVVTRDLPRIRRHNIELLPTLAALFDEHGLKPADLGELYVSLGPGSFTGLRIAITTAKMLALTVPGLKLVGVPTMEVLAAQHAAAAEHVAVCMNIKRGTMYTGVFRAGVCIVEPALRTAEELVDACPRPAAVVCEVDPQLPPTDGLTVLPPESAKADAAVTWRVGNALAGQGKFTPADDLLPQYIREPEAVTLWNELGRD